MTISSMSIFTIAVSSSSIPMKGMVGTITITLFLFLLLLLLPLLIVGCGSFLRFRLGPGRVLAFGLG